MPERLRNRALLARLRGWLDMGEEERALAALRSRYPGEVADLLELVERDERDRLVDLVLRLAAPHEVLARADADVLSEQMARLDDERVLAILRRLPADAAVAALRDLPGERRDSLAGRLGAQGRVVADLVALDEETVGGQMDALPPTVREGETVADALARLRGATRDDWALAVHVVDADGRLRGVVPVRALVGADPSTPVMEVAEEDPPAVALGDDKEEAIKVFDRYDLVAVPVVDEEGVLRGLLTVDDVFEIMAEEAVEDALLMAGLDEEELSYAQPGWRLAARRLSWLMVTVVGSLVSGAILRWREASGIDVAVMVAFVPVVMALGGAMGNQSAVITVKAIATGRLEPERPWRFFLRQVVVGLAMALMAGAVVVGLGSVTGLLPEAFRAIVAVSLVSALTGGAVIGAGIPLALHRAGADPAISSSPMIGTLCDLTGVTVYTGLLAAWG